MIAFIGILFKIIWDILVLGIGLGIAAFLLWSIFILFVKSLLRK